jgi:hypothetical protein
LHVEADSPLPLLLGPQSADRRVMHPKRPGDISQRFPRLSSRNRFALLMSVQLEGASHMDASGLCTNAPLASPHTNWLALEFREATNGKVACAKLYDRKTPITAADLLNDRVIPFFDSHDVKLLRVLTDRGSEYCGNPERHEYELYLAVEDIDHSRTKTKSPQTNGICERFHKTVLNEFYRVAFRKKVYRSIDELQADLDRWIREYNEARPHQGRWCFGKTPMQTFVDAMPMTKEKMIAA